MTSSSLREWSVRVRCDQYELGSSFSVLIFLLKVPSDPSDWFTSPNYVGSFNTYYNSPRDNSPSPPDYNIQGFVHLNDGVVKHSGLQSLEPNVVVPFLTKNLYWGTQKVDGTVVEMSSLEVVVLETPVTRPPGTKFPVYGEPIYHHGVTFGRPGGSRHA